MLFVLVLQVDSVEPDQLQHDLTSMNLAEVYEALTEVGCSDYKNALHLDDDVWKSLKDEFPQIRPTKFLRAKKLIDKKRGQASCHY